MSSEPLAQTDPILAGHQRLLKAYAACDVDGAVAMFSDDVAFMPPNEPSLFGKAEVKDWFEDYFEHFRPSVTATEREVTLMDGWATERCSYTLSILPVKGGDRIRDEGRWLFVWKFEADGVWRISHAMLNSIRPVGSGPSRFIAKMMEGRKKKR